MDGPAAGRRQARARQIFEAGCGLIRTSGRRAELPGLRAYGGGFIVWQYAGSPGSVVIDIWPLHPTASRGDLGPPAPGHPRLVAPWRNTSGPAVATGPAVAG